ncbi:MAG TPA: hypothetical protein VFK29_05920 [Rhodanobacteraceae bacterium]|jgi:hypothetical protein|nr:hypothetical protein [Rhodanobacteraceae bacterium]
MKHLTSWLTVLLLGAVPLSAAALDYGPNRPLLAVENGAPQMPDVNAHAGSAAPMAKPDVASVAEVDAIDAAPAMPRVAPVAAPGAPRPGQAPSASNKPRSKIARPATAPSPASWQSLLPGSIQ